MSEQVAPATAPARAVWIDILRVTACLAVVAFHVAIPVVSSVPEPRGPLWLAGSSTAALASLCVPLFVLVSGALLIPRAAAGAGAFYRRRLRLLPAVVFWTLLYIGIRALSKEALSPAVVLHDLVRGVPYYHLWYLFMLPGLYLLTPLLARYVNTCPTRWRAALLTVFLLCASMASMTAGALGVRDMHTVLTRFIPFLGYYLAGYELSRIPTGRLPGPALAALAVLAAAAIPVTNRLLWIHGSHRIAMLVYQSHSPLVILFSLAFFLLIHARFQGEPPPRLPLRVLRATAPAAFGIYLVHPLLLRVLAVLEFPGALLPPAAAVPAVTTLVFVWSFLAVEGIRRIPGIKHTV